MSFWCLQFFQKTKFKSRVHIQKLTLNKALKQNQSTCQHKYMYTGHEKRTYLFHGWINVVNLGQHRQKFWQAAATAPMFYIALGSMGATVTVTPVFTTNTIRKRAAWMLATASLFATTPTFTANRVMEATVMPAFTTNSLRKRTAPIAYFVSLATCFTIITFRFAIWASNALNNLNGIFDWCVYILHNVLKIKIG